MPSKSTTETRYQFLVRTIAEHSSNECLIWPFPKCKLWGYAYVHVPTEPGRSKRIHRVAYKLKHGHYPVHDACHSCDNRACYNPNHIFDGTDLDNFADMIRKGRSMRGEKNNMAVLTEKMVIQARTEYRDGGYTRREMAEKYGLSIGGMRKLLSGHSWPHITVGLSPAQIARRPRSKSLWNRQESSSNSSQAQVGHPHQN